MSEWIFTHGDGDGLCAGSIALAAKPHSTVFFTHPVGLLEDLEQVKPGDSVIICDISLSQSHISEILERFREISKTGNLIYIDHHPLPASVKKQSIPGQVLHKTGSSASELAYILFHGELNPFLSRNALYGAIADYLDDTPVVHQLLKRWDKRTIYLETGILVQGIEGLKRDHEFKRHIVQNLAKNFPPSLDRRLLELAIENTHREEVVIRELKDYIQIYGKIAYVLNFPFSLGKTAIYARALAEKVVGVAGEERKGFIDMSLRTGEENVDLNNILRDIAPRLGGSGGGHPAAAGARIPKQNFQQFIRKLNEAL
ncbi:DHH family phosphoesterase [Candidatus Bathyarchaeota archaeon]|nr:MAG: DHH family phosphoesterase [Candidatus Bathyarchaeota archaeon]